MSKYDRDSADVYAVKKLGDEIGYGHLMALAHELWARHLESKGLPRTGAFVAVSFPMVKEEYQADAIRDQIYTIIVSKALDTADTPQTEELKCRNKSYYESCEYEDNCNPTVCFKALDEFQDAVTDCDHKCIQTEVGCERTDCP